MDTIATKVDNFPEKVGNLRVSREEGVKNQSVSANTPIALSLFTAPVLFLTSSFW